MPTKAGGYFLADGTRVPSVTTVLSRYGDKGGLLNWAWRLGKEGKDYREERDIAADAGTMAHAAVEAWVRGQQYQFEGPDEVVTKAQTSFQAFCEWRDQTQLRITHAEVPLVSEKYKFAGTFDAILVRNARCMGDWKCANAVYPEYLMQIAAYGLLWEENYPTEPILGGYALVRFDRTYGDFSHRWWPELNAAREAFLCLRRVYELNKELTKRAK